jgi:hypothetical protein
MKHINTDFIHISFIDNKTALLEAVEGVEIDKTKSKNIIKLIEKELSGNFGFVIDRKSDYSIAPIEVYTNLNQCNRLKAVAIVVHNKTNFLPSDYEKRFYKGEIKIFEDVSDAHAWITSVVN